MPAERLRVEITETTLMRDPDNARRVLDELRATGVRVSIDDFGTGYSSLAYLKRLPADELVCAAHGDRRRRYRDRAVSHRTCRPVRRRLRESTPASWGRGRR